MAKYLEKVSNLRLIIKQNGGLIGSIKTLFTTDDLKYGELVGKDAFGNRYYINTAYFVGRSRWVKYADHFFLNYDGSQIPAEWHRWLHYTTDKTPIEAPPTPRSWLSEHRENWSGTEKSYMPYSTVPPKIQAWKPPQK